MSTPTHEIDLLEKQVAKLRKQLNNVELQYRALVDKKNENLSDLFDNSNDFIIIFKLNGEISFINETVKKKLGCDNPLDTKLKFIDLIHPDYQKPTLEKIIKASAGIKLDRFEIVLITSSGKEVFVTGKLTTVEIDGEVSEFRCVFYDITERIKAESAQSLYYQVANLATAEFDLETLLKNIYGQLNKMLNVNNFHVTKIYNASIKSLFSINEKVEEQDTVFGLEKKLIIHTLERNRSLILYENAIHKIARTTRLASKAPIPKIWIGVILKTSTVKGIMSICSYNEQGDFNNKDLELLEYIGGQIGLAMDREKNEEKIENQAATLSAIFDSSTHEIWSVNSMYRFTSFNHNYQQSFKKYYGIAPRLGFSLRDLKGRTVDDQLIDFWIERYKEAFDGKFTNFQIETVSENGQKFWREVFINPIFLPNGQIKEVSAIANDVTEKKRTESIIIASEEKFRNIFESFQDIYFRCDMNGLITMISPSVKELIGYNTEYLINKNISQFFNDISKLESIRDGLIRKRSLRNIEGSIITESGKQISCLFNMRLIQSQNGSREIEGVARDISTLKQTNKALKKAKEMAEHSLKIKERFLANMSHEIRTPMNGIIGMVELLASTTLDHEQSDYVKTIHKSTQTLHNIVNDILDLSKIEAGKMELRNEPVNIVKLIEKIYELFSQQASAKENPLYYYIDDRIPEWIEADETRLIQVFSNLTSNAIKFSKNKGVIHLDVRLVSKNDHQHSFKVSVKDSGIGISEENQKTLFQNFQQVDNSRSKNYGGTGLGLVISKELVKSMNGDIGVVSTPGLGSTFWFTFEAREILDHKSHIPPEPVTIIKQFEGQHPSILLVDDNEVNRKVASSILLKAGCDVMQAEDGFKAIELVKNNKYDLIFMDIQMPDLDGIKTTREIRKLNLNDLAPIVAMTAYSMEEDKDRFINAGLDDYLAKPIKAELLINKIREWLAFEPIQVENEVIKNEVEDLIINQNTLHQLAKYGGNELIEATLNEFEADARQIIERVNTFLEDTNMEGIRKELHTLKGNAGTLGIEKLTRHVTDVEKRLKQNNFDNIDKSVEILNELFLEFQDCYQNMFVADEE